MNDSNDWLRVCAIDDIPVLGARVVQRSRGAPVALFRNAADGVFALLDRCPHKGGPLSQGIVHGERVACPLHGWNIDLTCGSAIAPDQGCTPAFAVRIDRGAVYLSQHELATIGADVRPLQYVAPTT